MSKKEVKFYIEQAIRKLPEEGKVASNVGNIKYYLRKAIAAAEKSEVVKEEKQVPAPVVKKPIPMNEQYNFQPILNSNTSNARNVVTNLDLMIEQEKKKLEEILNRKKKPKDDDDENLAEIFG